MRHSAESNLIIEYLREYDFIFEIALAHETGDPVCRKKQRIKNLVRLFL
jgi:hypothetical protein